MIGVLTKLKSALIAASAAFIFGNLVGAAAVYKWTQIQETARLNKTIELKEQEREAALSSLKSYYENRPPVEVVKTQIKEVIKHVPTNPICDVSPDERRMLDYARTGVRSASERVDEGTQESPTLTPTEALPRSAEVKAHAEAAVRYRECLAVAKALEQYLLERGQQF